MENKKEKLIGVGILCGILIVIIAIFIFMNNKPDNIGPVEDLSQSEDVGGTPIELKTDDEYYGKYDFVLTADSKNYIQNFIGLYKEPGTFQLWQNLIDYKMGTDVYFETYDGKQVSPVSEGKPFMIYFAGASVTDKTEDTKHLSITKNTENVALLKASANESDPNVYIIPHSTDVNKEYFRSTIANADFFYSVDRAISDLYVLTNNYSDVMIYFNADGTPVFAIHHSNLNSIIEYAQTVFNQDLTMKEVLNALDDVM